MLRQGPAAPGGAPGVENDPVRHHQPVGHLLFSPPHESNGTVFARLRAVWLGVDAPQVEVEAWIGVCPDGDGQRAVGLEGLRATNEFSGFVIDMCAHYFAHFSPGMYCARTLKRAWEEERSTSRAPPVNVRFRVAAEGLHAYVAAGRTYG